MHVLEEYIVDQMIYEEESNPGSWRKKYLDAECTIIKGTLYPDSTAHVICFLTMLDLLGTDRHTRIVKEIL